MADFLIRRIPKETLNLAKRMAAQHHHSVQEEISSLLIEGIRFRAGTWARSADLIRRKINPSTRIHSDSAALLREDRSC